MTGMVIGFSWQDTFSNAAAVLTQETKTADWVVETATVGGAQSLVRLTCTPGSGTVTRNVLAGNLASVPTIGGTSCAPAGSCILTMTVAELAEPVTVPAGAPYSFAR